MASALISLRFPLCIFGSLYFVWHTHYAARGLAGGFVAFRKTYGALIYKARFPRSQIKLFRTIAAFDPGHLFTS